MPVLAAAGPEAAKAFVEIGAVALALAVLARLAGRLGVTTIPFYLLAYPWMDEFMHVVARAV